MEPFFLNQGEHGLTYTDCILELNEQIFHPIAAKSEANSAKFTTPSDDPAWNPTYKYTLVGAVIGDSQVLLRWTGEPLDDIIQEGSSPGVEDTGGWWLKMSYRNRVEYEVCVAAAFVGYSWLRILTTVFVYSF